MHLLYQLIPLQVYFDLSIVFLSAMYGNNDEEYDSDSNEPKHLTLFVLNYLIRDTDLHKDSGEILGSQIERKKNSTYSYNI